MVSLYVCDFVPLQSITFIRKKPLDIMTFNSSLYYQFNFKLAFLYDAESQLFPCSCPTSIENVPPQLSIKVALMDVKFG